MKLKKRMVALLCVLMLVIPIIAGCSQGEVANEVKSITVVDDTGREVTIPQPLDKVVVANRYNSELIRGIGAIDKVISVDKNTAQDRAYWGQFDPENVIGKGQSELNYEKIAELGAQILITPDNGTWEEDIKKLEPFGIQVVVVSGYNNAELSKEIAILGRVFGKEKEAEKLTKFYQENMDLVAKKVKDVKGSKKVYWEYGDPNTTCIPGTSNDGWNSMIEN
ncbi:MAG: ABC transporter substrate-binding protein, partial [Eubacterium sp.]